MPDRDQCPRCGEVDDVPCTCGTVREWLCVAGLGLAAGATLAAVILATGCQP